MQSGGGEITNVVSGAVTAAGATAAVSSRNTKLVIVSVSVGVAIVGVVSHIWRRRRANANKRINSTKLVSSVSIAQGTKDLHSSIGLRNSGSPYPGRGFGGRSSIASSRFTDTTLVSNSVQDGIIAESTANLGFTQLGVLGLESVEKSIHYWENALAMLKTATDVLAEGDTIQDPDTASTIAHLDKILIAAYTLQRLTEDLFLHENSVLYAESEKSYRLRTVSSVESFMSAEDFLSDDEEITMSLQSIGFDVLGSKSFIFPLYEAALRLVENGSVPYRSLRQTELTGCKYGDNEYLAKLHCLRGAFSRIVSEFDKRTWISESGKEVLTQILIRADRDPKDFCKSFDTFVTWAQDSSNWALTESELKERGLRALTFYDIVLDFIFLDAFEDLEAPPASVLAVTQNRWLSNSFKETALSTAVWSVLKTKRRWLRYPDGFVAHFYDVSEHMMPTLAWGFLGPPSDLQDMCIFFKDKFLAFLQAIFSFDKVRYTTLDNLAEDVYTRMEEMYALVMERLETNQDV